MRLLILLLSLFQDAQIFEPTGSFRPAIQPVEITHVVKESKPARRNVYLAMWTATYCGPCRQWKATVKPRLQQFYYVREYEMTDPAMQAKYGGRIRGVPAFAVIDSDTGEWLTELSVGTIDFDTAKWMLDGQSLVSDSVPVALEKQPVRRETEPVERVAFPPRVDSPPRFIQWPGWGTIDLETYNRNCNCNMCNSIRAMQRDYQQRKQFPPQSKVTPDQEGTPDAVVEDLLDQMQLRTGDVLAELGCGDGRILIAAAKRGIRGIGVELDPERAKVAVENVRRSGLSELIEIEVGDALDFDLSRATVATAYLYPPVLAKLAPKLKQLRVVGSPYHEIPGLPMTQTRDIWIYRNGENHGTSESTAGRHLHVEEGSGSYRNTAGNHFAVVGTANHR